MSNSILSRIRWPLPFAGLRGITLTTEATGRAQLPLEWNPVRPPAVWLL